MDNITQKILDSLEYDKVLANLLTPNPADKGFLDQVIYKTLNIIALTTGLAMKDVVQLKWESILTVNSKNQPQLKDNIHIPKYFSFPINQKLHPQLAHCFNILIQPPLTSKIINKLSKTKELDDLLLPLNYNLGMMSIKELHNISKEINEYKNPKLTQQLFGRRVLTTCGYSNQTSRFLKSRFNLKTNKELFEFLGYDSQLSIPFKLSNISLTEGINKRYSFGPPPSFLDDDKHFRILIPNSKGYYPIQHFKVFYDFLNQLTYSQPIITQGIRLLLFMSLMNGVRLSTIIKLKWSDIINFDNQQSLVVLSKVFTFDRFNFTMNSELAQKVLSYFQESMKLRGYDDLKIVNDTEIQYTTKPNLNHPVFITNKGNPLTQPNLHREVRNALNQMGFQYANRFTTKSTLIMYGRRIIELKGNHSPTIKLLKKRFNIRSTNKLFEFLFINEYKGNEGQSIEGFENIHDHILYDI